MNSYLLLRDNKESGPYSFNDLLNHGLKAYDLVWVQGKSAAWRYASEVEELKEFAPAVEEQPFDRFFKKKPDDEKQEVNVVKKESFTSNRSVFVSLPGQKATTTKPEITTPTPASKTITITENPAAAEVKYPEPIEEIKEIYVKTLQQRKQKIARKNFLFKNLKKASVFFYFLALGVLIGFTLKSKTARKQIASQQTEQTQPVKTEQVQNIPQTQEDLSTVKSEIKEETKPPVEHIQKPVIENSESIPPKKETALNNKEIISTQSSPGVETNLVTGERNKKSRTEGETAKTVVKDDISKLVSVKSNDYKRGAFGGIRDLQLTVTNDSKYILDNVTVELQYLKPSEQALKSENVQFHSISPNGSLTIAIPPSNRGIKVACKIIKIESKELNDETAGL